MLNACIIIIIESPFTVFLFFSAFFYSLIKVILQLKFSTGERQVEDMMGDKGLRVLLCYKSTAPCQLC